MTLEIIVAAYAISIVGGLMLQVAGVS